MCHGSFLIWQNQNFVRSVTHNALWQIEWNGTVCDIGDWTVTCMTVVVVPPPLTTLSHTLSTGIAYYDNFFALIYDGASDYLFILSGGKLSHTYSSVLNAFWGLSNKHRDKICCHFFFACLKVSVTFSLFSSSLSSSHPHWHVQDSRILCLADCDK